MKRFWISWYQPTDDYRPVYDPKKESEPLDHNYWASGQRGSDNAWTMCAIVFGKTEAAAKKTIQVYWPEAKEWRFCEEVSEDWTPGDRFPMKAQKSGLDVSSQGSGK